MWRLFAWPFRLSSAQSDHVVQSHRAQASKSVPNTAHENLNAWRHIQNLSYQYSSNKVPLCCCSPTGVLLLIRTAAFPSLTNTLITTCTAHMEVSIGDRTATIPINIGTTDSEKRLSKSWKRKKIVPSKWARKIMRTLASTPCTLLAIFSRHYGRMCRRHRAIAFPAHCSISTVSPVWDHPGARIKTPPNANNQLCRPCYRQ